MPFSFIQTANSIIDELTENGVTDTVGVQQGNACFDPMLVDVVYIYVPFSSVHMLKIRLE